MTLTQSVSTDGPQEWTQPSILPGELKFANSDGFYRKVRQRVDDYFEGTGYRRRDCPQMYLKTAIVLCWFVSSYVLLVTGPGNWWLVIPLVISLGMSMAAIGFNVQHDGGHHAYSSRPWVNQLMATSLDLLGGSSYLWARKHNTIHHTFANITGHDDDINLGLLGRLSPHQPRLGFHRLQHLYLWFLYGFMPIKWHFFDDFRDLLKGNISGHRFARPKNWDLVKLIAGKFTLVFLILAIPLQFAPLWGVLLGYLAATFVEGVVLSVVFQLAHCVEEAEFPLPHVESGRMEKDWAEHQVQTTVDFARNSRVLTWFIGGLNFQIEHHLFPQVCHVHYPAIAPIVERTCQEFGLRYVEHKSFFSGVRSHYRWLRRLGRANDDSRDNTGLFAIGS